MDLAWEVLRSNRKAVSTKTKIWNSTKPGRDRTNSIKWPQIWVWNCSEPSRGWGKGSFLSSSTVPHHPPPFTSLSALLLYSEICAPHHCSIPKSCRQHCHVIRMGKLSELRVETPEPAFNHFSSSQASPEFSCFVPCRKVLLWDVYEIKRENTCSGMCFVFKNRPLNCSLSPQAGHGHIPGFPWIVSFITACKTQRY